MFPAKYGINLKLESTLADLPSYEGSINVLDSGIEASRVFEQNPDLPGLLVMEQDRLVGVISRRRYIQQMGRPYGAEVFYWKRPVKVIVETIASEPLVLPAHCTIRSAAQQALARPADTVYEPLVVEFADGRLQLLEAYLLLLAQTELLNLSVKVAEHQKQMTEMMYQATNSLISTLDQDTLLQRILASVLEAIPVAAKGWLFAFDQVTGALARSAIRGVSGQANEIFSAHQTYIGRAIAEKQTITLVDDDLQRNVLYTDLPQAAASAIYLPLTHDHQTLGVLHLAASPSTAFSENDLKLLTVYGRTATATLRNAMLLAEVQKLAVTDPLTGLLNRRGFQSLALFEIERSQRYNRQLSAMMVDIDLFKAVNDTYGHDMGDRVIATIGEICRQSVRTTDLLCRFGGEEFLILLPETSLEDALCVANRLRLDVAQTRLSVHEAAFAVTVSIGVAQLDNREPNAAQALDQLFNYLDHALYASKNRGRNRISLWEMLPENPSSLTNMMNDANAFASSIKTYSPEQTFC
jgi:diguanylate cyclase (GGDEF)-like protein